MSITFQKELVYEVVGEVDGLLQLHYQELTLNKDRVKLNPRWDHYAALEQVNAFLIFTARDSGKLIGYSAFFVNRHMHYGDLVICSNDVLFLHPDHRTGRTGIKLIRYCEEQAQARFKKNFSLTWHAKAGTTLAAILKRMGYTLQDLIFSKIF